MPLSRFQRLPEPDRARILTAAGQAFAREGYEGTSLNRILDDLGINKATAYQYFDSKADLFATSVRFAADHVLTSDPVHLDTLTAESFWPVVEEWYARSFTHVQRHPWMVGMVQQPLRLFQGRELDDGPIKDVLEEIREVTAALVRRGRALGVVRRDLPEDLLVDLLRGLDEAMDRWALARWQELDADEREPLVRTFVGMVRRVAEA